MQQSGCTWYPVTPALQNRVRSGSRRAGVPCPSMHSDDSCQPITILSRIICDFSCYILQEAIPARRYFNSHSSIQTQIRPVLVCQYITSKQTHQNHQSNYNCLVTANYTNIYYFFSDMKFDNKQQRHLAYTISSALGLCR